MEKRSLAFCVSALVPVRDTLDVISGKWKLLILISVGSGNNRFREIQRSIPNITAKVLSKELKELEQNNLIERAVYDTSPVLVEYTTTSHGKSLENVVNALYEWGVHHRKKIFGKK